MVVFYLKLFGGHMTIGHEIEYVRKLRGLSIIDVCNAMAIQENEYWHIYNGKFRPSVYQLIMFISVARYPLETIKKYR